MSTAIRFTVDQYDQMRDAGVLKTPGAERRLELILGEIREGSPIGPLHEEIVVRITNWTYASTSRTLVCVRVQNSIGIPQEDSTPQPDVVWAEERDYSAGRPLSSEVMLLIEVADSSLDFDLEVKGPLYAAGGVPEYWVVDVSGRVVHVFREPGTDGYGSHRIAQTSETIAPTACPAAALDLAWLFRAL